MSRISHTIRSIAIASALLASQAAAIVPVAAWTWEDALRQGIEVGDGPIDPARIDVSDVLRIDESVCNVPGRVTAHYGGELGGPPSRVIVVAPVEAPVEERRP